MIDIEIALGNLERVTKERGTSPQRVAEAFNTYSEVAKNFQNREEFDNKALLMITAWSLD